MKIDIVTIFPEMFDSVFGSGMLRLAAEKGLIEIDVHNLRDYTADRHRQVDDEPYGGGPGMVMLPEPFYQALADILGGGPFLLPGSIRTVLLSAGGSLLTHELAENLAGSDRLVFLCGRYEGVDARVAGMVTDEISIGDYVLSGGEIGVMAVVDAVCRLISGVLGAPDSLIEESFSAGLLEYPQFTRPAVWRGEAVPAVLTSGDHEKIRKWRNDQAVFSTDVRRPDLLNEPNSAESD